MFCISHFELVRKSKIKPGRRARLSKRHVEPSERVFRIAALVKVIVAIPDYVDQYHTALFY